MQATDVAFENKGVADRLTDPRMLRRGAGGFILLGIAAAVLVGLLPLWLGAAYWVMSGVAVAAYGVDKRAAQRRQWRVQEISLHAVSLLGGWPGAWLAQQAFRHKTVKVSFRVGFWLTVFGNLLLAAAILRIA